MKKITLLYLCFITLFLFGCNQNVKNNPNIDTNDVDNMQVLNDDEVIYEGELEVVGIAGEISFGGLESDKTLILSQSFEDHADHINIAEGKWEKWFKSEGETLPGNIVKFNGKIKFLDGAAGNHYYSAESIDNIEVVSFVDATGVKEILESWNYCDTDDDCIYIEGECPFGCYVPLYKDFGDIAKNLLDRYFDINGKTCVYSCLYADTVKCENYKCTIN